MRCPIMVTVAIAAVAAPLVPTSAQETPAANCQYVGYSANPQTGQLLGLTAAQVKRGSCGLMASFMLAIAPPDVYDNISEPLADLWGDRVQGESDRALSGIMGLAFVPKDDLMVYIGAGYSISTTYQKRRDRYGILGNGGDYWIKIDDQAAPLAGAGLIAKVGSDVGLQIGVQSEPISIIFGIGGALGSGWADHWNSPQDQTSQTP